MEIQKALLKIKAVELSLGLIFFIKMFTGSKPKN